MGKIFIGGAWPYANGSLHLGRVASVLPGDILARYFRAKGEDVLYVSGSDCHGTPVAVQAIAEGVTPHELATRYHNEFLDCFKKLGFSYDLYTRTDHPYHHKVVQDIFLKLLEQGYLYRDTIQQTYCEIDARFLPDRYVEGLCPVCGQRARGDQCDYCSTLLDPSQLINKTCKLCGNQPTERPTEHFYLALSKLQQQLKAYVLQSSGWKDNAVKLTERYLAEGLIDRAVTRDLSWGVNVPVQGYEHKKIYVWIEAVSGYLSASKQWAEETGGNWEEFWQNNEEVIAYYVHGKDNIPFHSLIWPAILFGVGNLHLPDRIISSEYMTLEGEKFSTSRNWAVWLPDILQRYEPDSIRYFLITNGPEKRDTDFSWREFIYSHNGELLGAFGNFVNRTLAFIEKSFSSVVPLGELNEGWYNATFDLYKTVGQLIEVGKFKDAIDHIFIYIRKANKYFDEQKPWLQIKQNEAECGKTLYQCVQIIGNLAQLLEPFTPFACEKIRSFLNIKKSQWHYIHVQSGTKVAPITLLFERINVKNIDIELEKLKKETII